MPLARILTFEPGDAAELARRLHDMGFQVQVAHPNEQHFPPADLDIEFAICDQQQALGRAAAIAAQLQAEVIVFPGAIPPLPKPIPEVTEAAALLADLRRNQSSEPTEIPEPQVIFEQPLEQTVQPITEDPDFSPTPPIEEPTPSGPSVFALWSDRLRGSFGRLRVRLANASAAGGGAIANGAAQFHQSVKQRMGEARTAWQQRQAERRERALILQQERQKEAELAAAAHEQQRQREEQEQREAALLAASAEQEELRRVQAEKERTPAKVERLPAPAGRQAAPLEEPEQQQVAETAKEAARSAPRRSGSLRGAVAGAVASAFLFLAGMVLANFRSIVPVSHNLNTGSIEQESPFGPATVHGPPGVTVGGKAVQASNAPVASEPPRAKPQPVRTSAPVAKRKSQWRHFRRQSESQDNATADDVVVRHFPNRNPPAQTAQRQKVKRYSDE